MKESILSRLVPTLIIEILFFRFWIGCVDLDEDGSKTFLSLHLDGTDDGLNLGFSLWWLVASRPLFALNLLPWPSGFLFWFSSSSGEDEDDDAGPDLPTTPNSAA